MSTKGAAALATLPGDATAGEAVSGFIAKTAGNSS